MKFRELQSYDSNPSQSPNPVCIHYKYMQSLQIYAQMYVCAVGCLVAQSCSTLCNPMNFSLPGSSVHGDSPSKNNEVGCHALPRDWTCVSQMQVDSLASEPPGKPIYMCIYNIHTFYKYMYIIPLDFQKN